MLCCLHLQGSIGATDTEKGSISTRAARQMIHFYLLTNDKLDFDLSESSHIQQPPSVSFTDASVSG